MAEFEVRAKSPLRKLQHFLHANPTAVPAIVLLLGIAAFGLIVGSRFLSAFNLSLIIQQVTIIGVIGVAQTLIVITAGIDLSVGAIMVLCSIIMGKLAVMAGLPAPLALLIGIAAGGGCGAVNGVLVTRLRLPPFIVTLGTWSIFFALNLWYSASETIRSQDVAKAAPFLQALGTPVDILGARFTYGSFFMLALVATDLVRAQPHRVWAASLRGRRRSRCGAARGHPHRPRPVHGLCGGRRDLRARRLGLDRTDRLDQPARPARPPISTASPQSWSAARACSADAVRSSARWSAP